MWSIKTIHMNMHDMIRFPYEMEGSQRFCVNKKSRIWEFRVNKNILPLNHNAEVSSRSHTFLLPSLLLQKVTHFIYCYLPNSKFKWFFLKFFNSLLIQLFTLKKIYEYFYTYVVWLFFTLHFDLLCMQLQETLLNTEICRESEGW